MDVIYVTKRCSPGNKVYLFWGLFFSFNSNQVPDEPKGKLISYTYIGINNGNTPEADKSRIFKPNSQVSRSIWSPAPSGKNSSSGGDGNALSEFAGTSGSFKFPLVGEAAGTLRALGWAAPLPSTAGFPRAQRSPEGLDPSARSSYFPGCSRARSLPSSRWPALDRDPRPRPEPGLRLRARGRGGARAAPTGCGVGAQAAARGRPAGRQREAGGAGQPRLLPEEAPSGHIAELSAVAAAPLVSRGPALAPPPLPPCRSRAAAQRPSHTPAGRSRPLSG
ncbi:hypothetical protein H8959_002224 [Pygathrix nigripes]